MSHNTILILLGILFSSVLVIENIVIPFPAKVFVRDSRARMLGLTCIAVWFIIGYWTRWKMVKTNFDDDEDNFDF